MLHSADRAIGGLPVGDDEAWIMKPAHDVLPGVEKVDVALAL